MKKTVTLPDTNFILRYLLRDIPEQFAEADLFFEKVRVGKMNCCINEAVLVECQYIFEKYYKVSRVDIASSLTGLLQYKGIANKDREVVLKALAIYSNTTLDPVDCLLAAHYEINKNSILTFDKKLKTLCSTT